MRDYLARAYDSIAQVELKSGIKRTIVQQNLKQISGNRSFVVLYISKHLFH